MATCQATKEAGGGGVRKLKWRPPSEGWFKCNFDGAFYQSLGQGATGVVIRDPIGNCSGGRAKGHPFCLDALTMEATAFKEGMILAGVWVFA